VDLGHREAVDPRVVTTLDEHRCDTLVLAR
jgi:hypothetical protein